MIVAFLHIEGVNGGAGSGGDVENKRYAYIHVLRILWNFAIQNYYDYCYSYMNTFEIGAQLKPKRCLCDFGELPKLIRRALLSISSIWKCKRR